MESGSGAAAHVVHEPGLSVYLKAFSPQRRRTSRFCPITIPDANKRARPILLFRSPLDFECEAALSFARLELRPRRRLSNSKEEGYENELDLWPGKTRMTREARRAGNPEDISPEASMGFDNFEVLKPLGQPTSRVALAKTASGSLVAMKVIPEQRMVGV
jgi:hypothetical protein